MNERVTTGTQRSYMLSRVQTASDDVRALCKDIEVLQTEIERLRAWQNRARNTLVFFLDDPMQDNLIEKITEYVKKRSGRIKEAAEKGEDNGNQTGARAL